MTRRPSWVLLLLALLLAGACGKSSSSSPTGPSSSGYLLRGVIKSGDTGNLPGATVSILEGANAGQSVTTGGNGLYQLALASGGEFKAMVSATGHAAVTQTFNLTTATPAKTWDVTLLPEKAWVKKGSGSASFKTPSYVYHYEFEAKYKGSTPVQFKLAVNGWPMAAYTFAAQYPSPYYTGFEEEFNSEGGDLIEVTASKDTEWSVTELRWRPTW